MLIESVNDDKWKEVKALLLDVLALDRPVRASYLGNQKISPEIRYEVESLLAFEDEADDLLQNGAIGLSKELFANDAEKASPMTGQTIGAYTIVSELGIGGMGVVYLADRRDGKFDQKVAIKLLKREFNAGSIRESFNREIAIQSKLVHPNVATMLDTGTTGDGIPYIVMEYVEGLPIDKYCRDNNLGLLERLKIFNKACDAVAFAHQNLIVHRDLKPSNIIVTPQGNPKLLDFGISRLLDETGIESTSPTLSGAMTPEYASPEQINGSPISTATDIYSLGIVLFKLLTGTYPYNLKGKVNGDILREITDSDPMLPSAAVSLSFSPIISSHLEGDIDNILLRSLNKEPELRYRTVEQFAEDIWRFIDGEPVSARPATLSYRFRKFYGRNRVAVVAASLILSTILIGSVVALWQANVARTQANIAADARNAAILESDRAKLEQAKSEKISKFMAKMISYANSAWYGEGAKFVGGDARVVDALLDMSDKIDVEFAAEPDVAAELHHKFGESIGWAHPSNMDQDFADLIKKKQAVHLLRALELRVQYYGDWHELVAKDLFYSHLLIGKNDADRAALLDRSLNMMRDTNPQNLNFPYIIEAYTSRLMMPDAAGLNEIYLESVTPQTNESKYEIGERYLREALPVFRLHYEEDNKPIFVAECKLAYALKMQGKLEDLDEHIAICREGRVKLRDPKAVVTIGKMVKMINDAPFGKNISSGY